MFFIYLIIGIVAVAIFGTTELERPSTASLLVQGVISYAIWAAYFIYLWSAQRGTLGMRLLGMQIGHEVDGRTLTLNQAAVRFAVLFGPQIVIGLLSSFVPDLGWLGFIGLLWLFFVLFSIAQSPTKQGIHDRYAQSMVVKAARRAA
jgi:uncharacterized RDD family membrane protein YckC